MSREVTVGLLVQAKNSAGGVLHAVGGAGKDMGSALGEATSKAREGMHAMAHAMHTAHHAIRLMHHASRFFKETIGEVISKSLEWRGAQDASVQAFHAFHNVVGTTAARVGDQFIPMLRGVAEAATPMLKQFQTWLRLNSELIASAIINWTVKLATALVNGVAFGVLQVVRAWYGWKMAVAAVQALVSEYFAMVLSGLDKVMHGFQQLAAAVGKDEWVKSIADARKDVAGLGAEFSKSGDEAMTAIYAEIKALDDKEKAIEKVRDIIVKGIDQAGVKAFKNLKAAINDSKMSAEEEEKLTARVLQNYEFKAQALAAYNAAVAAAGEAEFSRLQSLEQQKVAEILKFNDGTIKGVEKMWKAFEARRASLGTAATEQIYEEFDKINETKLKESEKKIEGYFNSVLEIGKSAFDGIGTVVDGHTKTMGDGFKQLFGDLGRMIADTAAKWVIAKGVEAVANKAAAISAITEHAAGAAAGAAESQAAIPIVGPALAIAAAVAMFAGVMAFAGKFHSGGIIGGSGDRIIIGQSGELVVDRAKTPAALAMGFGPGGSPRAASMNMVVNIQTLAPPDRTDWNRTQRDVIQPATDLNQRFGSKPYGRYGGG